MLHFIRLQKLYNVKISNILVQFINYNGREGLGITYFGKGILNYTKLIIDIRTATFDIHKIIVLRGVCLITQKQPVGIHLTTIDIITIISLIGGHYYTIVTNSHSDNYF
jgi:hypothetical protein